MKNILIISGFSASGKGTLVERLLAGHPGELEAVRSYTTRARRNEADFYTFVTKEEFLRVKQEQGFLETNEYSENYYGTPVLDVRRIMDSGKKALIEVDFHGMENIVNSGLFPKSAIQTVFIATSAQNLHQRLVNRRTESHKSMILRLKTAIDESQMVSRYDRVIINDDLEQAMDELERFLLEDDAVPAEGFFDEDLFREQMTEIIAGLESAGELS